MQRCSPHSRKMRYILSGLRCAKYALLEIRGLSYPMPFLMSIFFWKFGVVYPGASGGREVYRTGPGGNALIGSQHLVEHEAQVGVSVRALHEHRAGGDVRGGQPDLDRFRVLVLPSCIVPEYHVLALFVRELVLVKIYVS